MAYTDPSRAIKEKFLFNDFLVAKQSGLRLQNVPSLYVFCGEGPHQNSAHIHDGIGKLSTSELTRRLVSVCIGYFTRT